MRTSALLCFTALCWGEVFTVPVHAQQADSITVRATVLDACTKKPIKDAWFGVKFGPGEIVVGSADRTGRGELTAAVPSYPNTVELFAEAELGSRRFWTSFDTAFGPTRTYYPIFYLHTRRGPCV